MWNSGALAALVVWQDEIQTNVFLGVFELKNDHGEPLMELNGLLAHMLDNGDLILRNVLRLLREEGILFPQDIARGFSVFA
jgi:hypothetical protein